LIRAQRSFEESRQRYAGCGGSRPPQDDRQCRCDVERSAGDRRSYRLVELMPLKLPDYCADFLPSRTLQATPAGGRERNVFA
jgi:hypothetical protein